MDINHGKLESMNYSNFYVDIIFDGFLSHIMDSPLDAPSFNMDFHMETKTRGWGLDISG